jgi:oligoribonuclease NrnB/cAMP/cGMP phosphodiesterase (DHH superfamily)
MKPLVIYHANCADGFGAAFAAWLKLGDDAEYLPKQYGEVKNANDLPGVKGRDVYILDFSFDRGIMETLMILADKVVWLDHHKTAFEMWCGKYEKGMRFSDTNGRYGDGNHDIILDDNKSGAMIAWEWFHGTSAPMLIKHIDDYDRWQFKLEGTKEFNKALWSYAPWTFEQWKREFLPADMGKHHLTFEQTARYSELRKEGAAILRAHDQNVKSVVKGSARACSIRGNLGDMGFRIFDGLAANCPPFLTSDVGHELANQSGTFGLCWTLNKDKPVANCSLRSNGDYDVSAIAKAFGGGGHKNAAGFEVPIDTLLAWMS